jgi:hypothetical protein
MHGAEKVAQGENEEAVLMADSWTEFDHHRHSRATLAIEIKNEAVNCGLEIDGVLQRIEDALFDKDQHLGCSGKGIGGDGESFDLKCTIAVSVVVGESLAQFFQLLGLGAGQECDCEQDGPNDHLGVSLWLDIVVDLAWGDRD